MLAIAKRGSIGFTMFNWIVSFLEFCRSEHRPPAPHPNQTSASGPAMGPPHETKFKFQFNLKCFFTW